MKHLVMLLGLLLCAPAFAADKTIHDFSSAGTLTGAEEVPIWQSSATKKTTITNIVGLTLPRTLAADTTVDLGTNNLRFATNNTAMNAVIEGPISIADWETFAPLGLQGFWALGTNGNGGGSSLGAMDFSNVANGAGVFCGKSRGTAAVPLAVQNGDELCGLYFNAYDGTALQNPNIITSVVTGVPSSGSVPAATVFYNGGSVGGFVESGRILDSGVLSWAHNITTTGTVAGSNLSGTNTGDQDLSGYVPTTRTVNGSALSSNVTISTISGNAGTATALAANPTDCGAGTKATAIDASGNLTCSAASLTADVSGTLPVANGGTGITSLGSGVATWWGTPSSANLASALTDEQGSGAAVFATSPTLTTPVLGAATATSLNLTSGNTLSWNSDTFLGRRAAAGVMFGAADAAAPVAQTISFQGARGGTDTNTAAVATTIQGSLGTGTGATGDIVFKCGTPQTTGTTAHVATACLTLHDAGSAGTAKPQTNMPDGVTGNPSYSFTNSTNTGLYSRAANVWTLSSGGTSVLEGTGSIIRFPSTVRLNWGNGAMGSTTDSGFARNAVGVVEFNDGTAGHVKGFLGGGTSVASATALPLPTGNVFHVTGTTNITSITSTNFGSGVVITLIFDGVLTFTDGSNLVLAGNFVTTADDTITLTFDGTNWYEIARSVN